LGCDSVLTFLRITVNKPILNIGTTFSGCDSVLYKGKKYIQNTDVIDTIRKKVSPFCDSIYTTHTLVILPKVVYSKEYNPDSTIEQGERVTLKINGGSSYQWSTSSTSNSIMVSPLKSNIFYVTVSSPNECSAKDSFRVNVIEIPSDVVLPNAFSPNGDHINDRYSAKVIGKAQITSFKIFNRWGEKVYEGKDNFSSWNGTYKGEEAPIGIYIYVVEYKLFEKFYTLKGSLSLIK
jgi:gliding motility-associated-like protein